jgi:adenylate cyclase
VTRAELARRTTQRMSGAMLVANGIGAGVVYVFLSYLLPTPVDAIDGGRLQQVNAWTFVAYMTLTAAVGQVIGDRNSRPLRQWLRSDQPADDAVRRMVLRNPLVVAVVAGGFWCGAALVFGTINGSFDAHLGVQVVSTIALGGVTTISLAYLLSERILRPVVTLAHQDSPDPPPILLSVTRRMVLAWVIGSGVPLLGIAMGFVSLGDEEHLGQAGVLFLVAIGLLVGFLATVTAARAVADPVHSVAAALRDVGEGWLDVAVPVYDASEIGRLQAGFNAMAEGLRERERLRDLFGRQVGTDVARLAMERGVRLGGERREVAVLFVDVVGSTALAVKHDPEEVVRQLNAFFAVVVETVSAHGGWVNKFEGDAALCVFGAPVERADAAACALVAARALCEGLGSLDLTAAIGVCAGPVVAGNVGTESRFEYTVIGDPVNTAARLAELARATPGRVLADGAVVAAAGEESREWELGEQVVLRGRAEPTRLACPRRAG